LNNHREYIEKVIKSIAKAKYKDMTKKEDKRNRLRGGGGALQQKKRKNLRFLITPQFDVIGKS
jgi:hypothetical protein